ncbi:hypothetical protein [Enterococcus mundtii]|uniref:hypothetical protein n=1 Tax=Enterococcus mundtii TaxID=53346 RepID=UPI001A9594A7|nr:hypothetical protein [Enterococcus mundtii]MBO1087218.1 hypothetical protein [Enterococcus mundtii]
MKKGWKFWALTIVTAAALLFLGFAVGGVVGYNDGITEKTDELSKVNNELDYDYEDIEGYWLSCTVNLDRDNEKNYNISRFVAAENDEYTIEDLPIDQDKTGSIDLYDDSSKWTSKANLADAMYNSETRSILANYMPTGDEDQYYGTYFSVGKDFDYMTRSYEDHINGSNKKVYYIRLPKKDDKYQLNLGTENTKEYIERSLDLKFTN